MKADPNFSCILHRAKKRILRSQEVVIEIQPMEAEGFSRVDGFDIPNGIRFPLPPKITVTQPMRPKEYLKIKEKQDRRIEDANRKIDEARRRAMACRPPKDRREATADDIIPGAIIWHENDPDFWNVVEEPLHYGDPFKAYTADDGCRYGLRNAYIEL